jgi:hypothetical protein
MKSLPHNRVLLMAGLLASSAIFLSACSVDNAGLEQVDDGGEPDGTGPAPNADGGDATTETGSDASGPDGGPLADAGDGGVAPGADATRDADAGDATLAADGEVDATADAGSEGGTDAAEPDVVGDVSAPVDAPEDTAVPEDAEDTGTADVSVEDTGVDTGPDTDAVDDASDAAPATVTTISVIASALGDACAYAATNANCLPTLCEDLTGTPASANVTLCLTTLTCALSASTATTYCGFRQDTTNECYCGDADPGDCQAGLADGVCMTAEADGFGTNDPPTIYASYSVSAFPSGLANSIVSCMAGLPLCTGPTGI